ncbi:ATP-dependent zinc protease family protein [Marinobacterium sp. YM272]|uniref:ATP-dependent zinc protease family protein n=1 Tax=Marinobacterium sp. YM272 TaxID=3421654 RepID=UPI003D7FC626
MFRSISTPSFSAFRSLRLLILLPLTFLLTACAQDQYLFLDRADLAPLQKQMAEQQLAITALRQQTQEQFDLLETRQQLRQSDLNAQLQEQRALIKKRPAPVVEPRNRLNTQAPAGGRYQGKLVVGELEPVYLAIPGVIYEARIDSGAETSSLHATNIERFERDGERWVRFDIEDPNHEKPITLERQLSRNVRIIQASADESERRAVVELPFMIGDHRQSAEFTLTDRDQLTYSLLIGRNVLRDVMLVDVGRENVTTLPENLDKVGDSDE